MGKWREMVGRNSMRQEDSHYAQSNSKTVIRSVLMYRSETWTLRKAEQNLPERTEITMLRQMMGIKRIEKTWNEEIRGRTRSENEMVRPLKRTTEEML